MGAAGKEETKGPRVRKNGLQNADVEWCWATTKVGKPCCRRAAGDNLPYCRQHLESGNPIFKTLDNPTTGKFLVPTIDLPKGYRMVYFGTRRRWRECKDGSDRAMTFRDNGGVIDPFAVPGQQLQYMACPGPGERINTRGTDKYFGRRFEDGLVGREFVTTEVIPKHHQMMQWYGNSWFEARGITRENVGTARYPALKRRASVHKDSSRESNTLGGDGDMKRVLGEVTNMLSKEGDHSNKTAKTKGVSLPRGGIRAGSAVTA